MGRKKMTIKRLESANARQIKYSKRKTGILKKAKELSVLCDVDLALIMFSPTGKSSLYVGQNKELLSVVDKLSRISIEEREQRRGYTIELLKKTYADTDEDIRNVSLEKSEFLKLRQDHLKELKENIAMKNKILDEWTNPQNIKDLEKLRIMENHLFVSLENIKAKKRELIVKEQHQQQGVQASERELQHEYQHEQTGRASHVHLENKDLPI